MLVSDRESNSGTQNKDNFQNTAQCWILLVITQLLRRFGRILCEKLLKLKGKLSHLRAIHPDIDLYVR